MAARDQQRDVLAELERKVLWLSSWTIHHANHMRDEAGRPESRRPPGVVGVARDHHDGALFRRAAAADRVAVKPHASPIFHAIQYLLGSQTLEKLESFRGYKGAQSLPLAHQGSDDVDFSTGSVGLGVAQTLFASLAQDYVRAHGWTDGQPEGRMIALVGDAELDEGNIFEAMLEGWKRGLRNLWWVIDYNRQSLDAVTGIAVGRYERCSTSAGRW